MNRIEMLDILMEIKTKLENLNLMIDQQAQTIYVPQEGRTPVVIVNDLMKEQVVEALECIEQLIQKEKEE